MPHFKKSAFLHLKQSSHGIKAMTLPANFGYVLQVVPPVQARKIYKALIDKGLPVALIEYEGEQHGFRKVIHIKY